MNPKTISAVILFTVSSFGQFVKASYHDFDMIDSQEGVTSPPDDDDSVAAAPAKRAMEIDAMLSEFDAIESVVDLKSNPHLNVFDREYSTPVEDMEMVQDPIPEIIAEPIASPSGLEYNEFCVNQLIDTIQYDGTAEYVDQLYNWNPLVFQRVDRKGLMILIHANQVQINHLVQSYGQDQLLMERIFEACCRNPYLQLPGHLFRIDDSERAFRRIEYVRDNCPRDKKFISGTHLGPDNLDFLLPTGETLLNRALLERNYFVMRCILKRADSPQIVLMKNIKNENVFDFIRTQALEDSSESTHQLLQSIPQEYERQIKARYTADFSKLFALISSLKMAAGNDQKFLFEIAGEVINLMGEEIDHERDIIMPQLVNEYVKLLAICPKVGTHQFSFVQQVVEMYRTHH